MIFATIYIWESTVADKAIFDEKIYGRNGGPKNLPNFHKIKETDFQRFCSSVTQGRLVVKLSLAILQGKSPISLTV